MSRRILSIMLLLATAGSASAQGIDDPRQPPDRPRSGSGGFGGIGISLSFPLNKKPKIPDMPRLEMRDSAIADHVAGRVIFVMALPAVRPDRVARAARVTIAEITPLDQIGKSMVVANLAAGDTVAAAVARLQSQPGVDWAQPDLLVQSLSGGSRSKGFKLHGIPDSDRSPVAGVIAMIDTAVDTNHPAMRGAGITQSLYGIAAAPSAHGTAIAEILVGRGDFPGTAPGARLVSFAAFAAAGENVWLSQTSYLARAMNDALRLRPNVLNLSFGRNGVDPLVGYALDRFRVNGVCVVAAAGNGSGGPVLFPATHPASLAITAVDGKLRAYAYASRGPQISLAAWGVDLSAAVPGGRRAVSGTSFATAVVSGALLRTPECGGGRAPVAMKARLMAQARDLGPKGADAVFGAGLFELQPAGKPPRR